MALAETFLLLPTTVAAVEEVTKWLSRMMCKALRMRRMGYSDWLFPDRESMSVQVFALPRLFVSNPKMPQ